MIPAGKWKEILPSRDLVDSHVHTHLCDGKDEMTVEAIANQALKAGLRGIVLTPHFHKRLEKEGDVLFEDSREEIFLALREEIRFLEKKHHPVSIFLSTEVDIVNEKGDLSADFSPECEKALDFVSPTLNFHPLLPYPFISLTYGKEINSLHDSGAYTTVAEKAGGVAHLLETEWEIRCKALEKCPYPAMAGHIFASISKHPDRYAWFAPEEKHMPLMEKGAKDLILLCKKKGFSLDLTGVHVKGVTAEEKADQNGFLTKLQKKIIALCQESGVPFYYGSDAHRPEKVGAEREYYKKILNV